MKLTRNASANDTGLTLLELMVVVVIIGTLMAILIPAVGKGKELAVAAKSTAALREIGLATLNWASDNGNRLPSPQYPGGMEVPPNMDAEDFFPEFYNLGDSGLWLDGVVFGQMYLAEDAGGATTNYEVDSQGTHLKNTFFESVQSVKKDPLETDWHRHSYAMNSNLQYDRIYDQVSSSDPYLTEKTLANLTYMPKAMLYIECSEPNVVDFEDRETIIATFEERWSGGKGIVTFLDGHAERLGENEIPDADPETDRESSWFWRGVDPD
ncbi:MAG: prepilin-type N-terminal cleavage/methylation domain-containing protein [Verrucomicrobiota bacterium]